MLWQRKLLKKPKKVKPNYKRKLATERDKVKRKYSNKKDKGFPLSFFIPLFTGIIISGEWKKTIHYIFLQIMLSLYLLYIEEVIVC